MILATHQTWVTLVVFLTVGITTVIGLLVTYRGYRTEQRTVGASLPKRKLVRPTARTAVPAMIAILITFGFTAVVSVATYQRMR